MSLVKDATVRIHRPEPGYAPDGSDGDFLGSGFFIAPSWVLTCAHVAMEGRGRQVDVVYKPARGGDAVRVGGTVVAALPEERPGTGGWPPPTSRSSSCSGPSNTPVCTSASAPWA